MHAVRSAREEPRLRRTFSSDAVLYDACIARHVSDLLALADQVGMAAA
jgi:hypothetical protein